MVWRGISATTLRWRKLLSKLYFDDSVETIGESAFEVCVNIRDVRWSENLKSIGNRAFYYMSRVNGIFELPASLEEIGDEAFYYIQNVDELILGKSLKRIGEEAFYNLSAKTIRCNAPTPPECGSQVFRNYDCNLYVDDSSFDLYVSAAPWKYFDIINDIEDPYSSVEAPTSDDTIDEIYTLSGMKVADGAQLSPGIYIVRNGRQTRKIVMK